MKPSLSRSALLLGSFLALSPLGCMSAAIDRSADAQIAEVRAQTESAVVNTSCPDGRPLAASCGLMLRHYASEEFRAKFRESFCKDMSTEVCQTRYERMINARLEERYYAADHAAVTRTCDANPGRCDDPVAYEMALLDSHNGHVLQAGARAELERREAPPPRARGRRPGHARHRRRGHRRHRLRPPRRPQVPDVPEPPRRHEHRVQRRPPLGLTRPWARPRDVNTQPHPHMNERSHGRLDRAGHEGVHPERRIAHHCSQG
ncbi:MAG: hypothetical protein QM820_24215 [Minicystis sp.]